MLVTIDIGGNDIVGCATPQEASPDSPCATQARARIKRNLRRMLVGLHKAACHQGAPEGGGDDPNTAGAAAIASAFEHTIHGLCARKSSAILRQCRRRA